MQITLLYNHNCFDCFRFFNRAWWRRRWRWRGWWCTAWKWWRNARRSTTPW